MIQEELNEEVESDAVETEGKNIAIIAYLTIIGLIIAFVMNNDKKNAFASFHIGQSLGLGLTGLALLVINIVPILGWILSIVGSVVLLILWISGLINALNAKRSPVPILGKQYQKWFKNI